MERKELRVKAISKRYKKSQTPANRNVTISLREGELTALIGHNGAGKTTLLNQIIGNIRPDEGDIQYDDISLVKNTELAREKISMMPQFYAPLSGVTMRQSIECVLLIRGERGKSIRECADNIMSELDILQWADKSGDELSGGLLRLTSFAMAVAKPAEIVLLDEPTNDVDPVRKKKIWAHIKDLSKQGHIILVVTHNLLEVEQYADRYILLDNGSVLKDETISYTGNHNHTLTITLKEPENRRILFEQLKYDFQEDNLQLRTTLSSDQVSDAMAEVVNLLEKGVVVNYKLSPASLEVSYGGLIGAKKANQ